MLSAEVQLQVRRTDPPRQARRFQRQPARSHRASTRLSSRSSIP
jgi:hypothetical protein